MPCGCLVALLCGPRLAIFLTWLFGWFGPQFETRFWPLMGFFFMPWTAFAYAGCATYLRPPQEALVPWVIVMVIAVSADLGTHGGSARHQMRANDE